MNCIKKLKSVFIVFLIFISFFLAPPARAATLDVSSASQNYNVGDTIALSISVGSGGEAVNAVSGTLLFPKDLVTVSSISKTNTVINYWVTEPSFSNGEGTVSFAGIIPNPGFSGVSGQIIKINLRAEQKGSGSFTLSDAAVLANDGAGTNVLANIGQMLFSIGGGTVKIKEEIPTPAPEKGNLPEAPIITSDATPDQTKWYPADNIKVNWQLPEDVTRVYASIDKNEKTIPRVLKTGSQISFLRNNLASSVWYVHVRFRNNAGFGPVSSYKINIDTTPPDSFVISEVANETDNTRANFNIFATDALSGIDKYSFAIDNNTAEDWVDDGSHIFTTEVLAPGSHTISGIVSDKAGNETASSLAFSTVGVETPLITSYPSSFKEGEQYKIEGTAFPQSKIKVFVSRIDGDSINDTLLETSTGEDGHFSVVGVNGLPYGTYNAYAKSYLGETYESLPSNQVQMISLPTGFDLILSIFKKGTDWLNFQINKDLMFILECFTLIILIILLIFLMFKYPRRHPKVKSPLVPPSHPLAPPPSSIDFGTKNNSPVINHAIGAELAILEKINSGKDFTTEERHFLSQLHRDLDYLDTKN